MARLVSASGGKEGGKINRDRRFRASAAIFASNRPTNSLAAKFPNELRRTGNLNHGSGNPRPNGKIGHGRGAVAAGPIIHPSPSCRHPSVSGDFFRRASCVPLMNVSTSTSAAAKASRAATSFFAAITCSRPARERKASRPRPNCGTDQSSAHHLGQGPHQRIRSCSWSVSQRTSSVSSGLSINPTELDHLNLVPANGYVGSLLYLAQSQQDILR